MGNEKKKENGVKVMCRLAISGEEKEEIPGNLTNAPMVSKSSSNDGLNVLLQLIQVSIQATLLHYYCICFNYVSRPWSIHVSIALSAVVGHSLRLSLNSAIQ